MPILRRRLRCFLSLLDCQCLLDYQCLRGWCLRRLRLRCRMASKAEETAKDVSAQSIKKVHLIVRNTRTWSNSELSKKCKLKEYDAFGTDGTQTDSPGSGEMPARRGGRPMPGCSWRGQAWWQ